MTTPIKTCHPQGGTELECDSKGTSTPAAPQSSDSKSNISSATTCQSQGGGPDLEHSMVNPVANPTLFDPLSSALVMITPANTCQPEGGDQLECDNKGPPVALLQLLSPMIWRGKFCRLAHEMSAAFAVPCVNTKQNCRKSALCFVESHSRLCLTESTDNHRILVDNQQQWTRVLPLSWSGHGLRTSS